MTALCPCHTPPLSSVLTPSKDTLLPFLLRQRTSHPWQAESAPSSAAELGGRKGILSLERLPNHRCWHDLLLQWSLQSQGPQRKFLHSMRRDRTRLQGQVDHSDERRQVKTHATKSSFITGDEKLLETFTPPERPLLSLNSSNTFEYKLQWAWIFNQTNTPSLEETFP